MKHKLLGVLVVIVMLVVASLPTHTTPVSAAGNVSYTFYCDAVVVSGTSDQASVGVDVIVRWSGLPGTIRARGAAAVGADGAFNLVVPIDPPLTNPAPAPFGPVDPDNMEQFFWFYGMDGSGTITETYLQEAAICEGRYFAGCDITLGIPSDAIGATITADTAVYWAPGQASTETFPAGLNVLAIGVDASGAYTKVGYACGFYWVPTGVIGPNSDAPWNGTPLPTGVVE